MRASANGIAACLLAAACATAPAPAPSPSPVSAPAPASASAAAPPTGGVGPGWTPASHDEVAQVCRQILCRTPAQMHLKLAGGKSFDFTAPGPTPIVSGGLVTVLAGETVMVEGMVKEGRVVDLVAVKAIAHPERTLVFHLVQDPRIGDGTAMVLTVKSPFPGVVKYRLGMMLPSGVRLLKTSSCPLQQDVPMFESWPHPIFQLVATDFRLVDPKSPAATLCE